MKFGKMMACAAILGCTSAVNLDTENTLEANSQDRWTLPEDLITHINRIDARNKIGLRGAYKKCVSNNGSGEVCKTLERDVYLHKKLDDYMLETNI